MNEFWNTNAGIESRSTPTAHCRQRKQIDAILQLYTKLLFAWDLHDMLLLWQISASRAEAETQHHTHASIERSISCETSKNFDTFTQFQISNVRLCSFPHSYCASRAQTESQHHTHASIKTNISCETSSNFDTVHHAFRARLPRIFTLWHILNRKALQLPP